jgi:hypothetical protein
MIKIHTFSESTFQYLQKYTVLVGTLAKMIVNNGIQLRCYY